MLEEGKTSSAGGEEQREDDKTMEEELANDQSLEGKIEKEVKKGVAAAEVKLMGKLSLS